MQSTVPTTNKETTRRTVANKFVGYLSIFEFSMELELIQ
jgi:hypothetical protein